MDEQELAHCYGPAAAHSEHQPGQRVMFLEEGKAYIGTLRWIGAACTLEQGTTLPMRYVIEVFSKKGWLSVVSPGDILERGRWEGMHDRTCEE